MYKDLFKRLFDLIFSSLGLILISPIFVCMTFILWIANSGSGIFFTQRRPGKNNKILKVIKFKTMNDKKDTKGNFLPDAQRITKIGSFICSYSLDEIPQLINVLKGDMSLIGPRPLLIEYLQYYNETQKRRHNIRPGITGWAQVNGRNAISWEKKFELDIFYVDNVSFILDIKIFLLTIKKVFKKEGINQRGKANEIPFKGSLR